ncbi:kinase-like protein [Gigaspora margarita]|uniref:Kinase-like protein n=1 Tax=Gigaspora margarita TaxID=4874 RepID=A0A8H4AEE4_GIGMA|nr:kinase-like protein [Gigaspora margarita]
MANTSEEWFERGISDGHINYHEYDKFTNREIIDVGGFGTVYKHEWQGCELTVALKCLKSNANTNRVFIRELKLLQRLSNHPSIIAFYGITKDNNGCYNMILQYADNGNLREYLKKNFVTLQWKCKLRIAKEIVHGLMFLHNNKIVHRDLHSKNILIHQGQIKITDFGLAKQINEISSTSASAVHGMAAYIDPQYFVNPKFKRNEKSDIYSLGVILWEISSGKPPFKSFELGVVLCAYIVQGHREKPIEEP